MLKIYNTPRKYTHCIQVNTNFKAQQMLSTDWLQVFGLKSLAHGIAFSNFETSLKMGVIDNKTREHAVTYTNQVLLLVGSPSHKCIIIAFYNAGAGLVVVHIRGAFGKFLAWSIISVTHLQTLSCLVSF